MITMLCAASRGHAISEAWADVKPSRTYMLHNLWKLNITQYIDDVHSDAGAFI
jgi:hypothetical protein